MVESNSHKFREKINWPKIHKILTSLLALSLVIYTKCSHQKNAWYFHPCPGQWQCHHWDLEPRNLGRWGSLPTDVMRKRWSRWKHGKNVLKYRGIKYLLGTVFAKLIDVIWPSVKQKEGHENLDSVRAFHPWALGWCKADSFKKGNQSSKQPESWNGWKIKTPRHSWNSFSSISWANRYLFCVPLLHVSYTVYLAAYTCICGYIYIYHIHIILPVYHYIDIFIPQLYIGIKLQSSVTIWSHGTLIDAIHANLPAGWY